MNRGPRTVFSLALALLAIGVSAGAEEPPGGVRIGVAPFERMGAAGVAVPDVASSLAQRLATKGVERVVGPRELGAAAAADPRAEDVISWAKRGEVEVVVVGRTTRLGDSLSIDTRLRSAATGAPIGTPAVVEANGPSDLGRAIDDLAALVLETIDRNQGMAGVQVAAPSPRGEPASGLAPAPEKGDGASEKQPFRSDAPISIKSNMLEAFETAGRKKFVFTGNVRAVQQNLHVKSDRLEAFYPDGQSQPERLEATGRVVITQTGKRALCEKATYFRAEQKLVCVGNAQLDEECDRVRGKEIIFHLDNDTLEVNGAADVRIHPEGVDCQPVDPARRAAQ